MGEFVNAIESTQITDNISSNQDGTKSMQSIKPKLGPGLGKNEDANRGIIFPQLKHIKYLLKDKGMTINGVKKHLNSNESELDELTNISINTKKVLKSKISKISKIIKDLKK